MKASELLGKSTAQFLNLVGPLAREDHRKSGILASITLAQFILESGWGKSGLTQQTCNCFGMKGSLSGSNWPGSTWDGKTLHSTETKEQTEDGTEYTITAGFRVYSCIEDSIADHSAYLAGAKKGKALRYKGLVGEKNYRTAAQIIKDGGYATDTKYVDKLCKLVEQYDLTQYDYTGTVSTEPEKQSPAAAQQSYKVKVTATALNVRKAPGTKNPITMTIRDRGIYTIVDEQDGWGKLKSGAGWIKLSYTKRYA